MYVEKTRQGYNIMDVSPDMLDKIVLALKIKIFRAEPEAYVFIQEVEKERNGINHISTLNH
jgi:hypothetical protein